jgi:transposase
LIRNDGEVPKQIASARRALGLSRSSVYRLLRRYRQAAQTSSLLVGHRGTTQQHRRLPESREAIVTRAIEEKFLARPRMTVSGLTEEMAKEFKAATYKKSLVGTFTTVIELKRVLLRDLIRQIRILQPGRAVHPGRIDRARDY